MEPSTAETVEILKGLRSHYESHHGVTFTDAALEAAVTLSAKYLKDLHLPDKAIDVVDEAGAAQKLLPADARTEEIGPEHIERVVAKMARVPVQSVSHDDTRALAALDVSLREVIFGQDAAIGEVASAIRMARSGLRAPEKPIGSFLFAGPTGVGKTELARQLARILGVEFIRYDMSEYMEKHAVSRLIGAPPGYVGYEEGGLLIDAVRKSPHAVLLLDEIEKAHPDMYSILLQVMDHATLTDSHGRKADFRHVILIMTTNAGRPRRVGPAARVRRNRAGWLDARGPGADLHAGVPQPPRRDGDVQRAGDGRGRARGGQAGGRAARAGCGQGRDDRARSIGARVAGAEGLRPRIRGAADGAADRPRGEEAVVGPAAVRLAWRRGARFASRSRTARSCSSRTAPVALSTPRRDYLGTPLLEDGAGEDPLALFMAWFQAAEPVEADATAMVLATAGRDGQPSARLVLLKELDVRGLTFFTNYESRKGEELAANDRASLLFYWRSLDRQVRVEGRVARITAAESDAYFAVAAAREPVERVRLAAKPSDCQPRRARGARGRGAPPVRRRRAAAGVLGRISPGAARVRVLARAAEQTP